MGVGGGGGVHLVVAEVVPVFGGVDENVLVVLSIWVGD